MTGLRPGPRPALGGAGLIGISAALAGCAAAGTPASAVGSSSGSPATSTSPTESPTVTPGSAAAVRDGTYQADGTYGSGPSTIGVQLTLASGVITAVQVTPHATNQVSRDYQQRFADAVSSVAVGQPVVGLHVDRLAGSSLTPDGFNNALATIITEAQQ